MTKRRKVGASLIIALAGAIALSSALVLVGPATTQRALANAHVVSNLASRTDMLPYPMRSLKGDRLAVHAGDAQRLVDVAARLSAPTAVLAFAPSPGAAAESVFERVMVPPETGDGAVEDGIEHDETALPDAAAVARQKPEVWRTSPLPGPKPADGSSAAQRASLVPFGASPAVLPPSKPTFFASLGLPSGRTEPPQPRVLEPVLPQRDNRDRITVPTPFGIPYVLQTQSVDGSCLKPDLVGLLRKIEARYGQKVVLTSGARTGGRDGSLHRTCEAADIIVPGVDSQALAAYARSVPGMGGVGTYCHSSMIHVDVGTPRNWHYGCGSSSFALRGKGSIEQASIR